MVCVLPNKLRELLKDTFKMKKTEREIIQIVVNKYQSASTYNDKKYLSTEQIVIYVSFIFKYYDLAAFG